MPDLQAGLGELEIKAEPLRYIACAGRDFIEDASINIEAWLMQKVATGFRWTINEALIAGDGSDFFGWPDCLTPFCHFETKSWMMG